MKTPSSTLAFLTARVRPAIVLTCLISLASLATLSAHFVVGLGSASAVSAFVSSPSAGTDMPIKIGWGTANSGVTPLRVACFYVANSSDKRPNRPEWPRVTTVGFELPDSPSGFALLSPLDGDWELIEDVDVSMPGHDEVTLDFAIVARVNPTGRTPGRPKDPRGIPPGQDPARGSGTRFCVSGPFPDVLPNLLTTDNDTDTVPTTIELLINGVVVGFDGVDGTHQGHDAGVWFPSVAGTPGAGPVPRVIPLYPQ